MSTTRFEIRGAVAVVTGANRGLGRHLAAQLLERGAAKVYAGARDPRVLALPGAVPLHVDVTDPETVARAAATAADATLLVNNAGISTNTPLAYGDLDRIRLEMETHYFGTLSVTRAFAPVLGANGGGAMLNVVSVASWTHFAANGAYCAAKAAEWALTNAVREELAPAGTQVTALHAGYIDTDMAAGIPPDQKADPAVVVADALDGLAAGAREILADEVTRSVKRQLSGAPLAA